MIVTKDYTAQCGLGLNVNNNKGYENRRINRKKRHANRHCNRVVW